MLHNYKMILFIIIYDDIIYIMIFTTNVEGSSNHSCIIFNVIDPSALSRINFKMLVNKISITCCMKYGD